MWGLLWFCGKSKNLVHCCGISGKPWPKLVAVDLLGDVAADVAYET